MEGEVALDNETSLVDTWKAMIALPKSKVKAVGVSNYTTEHLQGIIAATGIPPVRHSSILGSSREWFRSPGSEPNRSPSSPSPR